jgi:hypothetical protein
MRGCGWIWRPANCRWNRALAEHFADANQVFSRKQNAVPMDSHRTVATTASPQRKHGKNRRFSSAVKKGQLYHFRNLSQDNRATENAFHHHDLSLPSPVFSARDLATGITAEKRFSPP